MLDDADGFVQLARYFLWICDRPESAIENVVTAVRNVRLVVNARPELRACSRALNFVQWPPNQTEPLPRERRASHPSASRVSSRPQSPPFVCRRPRFSAAARHRDRPAPECRAALHRRRHGEINFYIGESSQRNPRLRACSAVRSGGTPVKRSFFRDSAAVIHLQVGGGGAVPRPTMCRCGRGAAAWAASFFTGSAGSRPSVLRCGFEARGQDNGRV